MAQVRSVSFTGSVGTGKRIYQSAADDVKRITLELRAAYRVMALCSYGPR